VPPMPSHKATQRPIDVSLDETEAPRNRLKCPLVIPAHPGPLTLHYPEWIAGEHSPNGPINDLSGLKLHAAGKELTWQRDELHLHSFHCTVPEGADAVEAELEYLATTGSLSARLASINWYLVTLDP